MVSVFPLKLRNAEDRVSPQPFPLLPRPLIIRLRQDIPSARALGPGRVWAGLQTSRAHKTHTRAQVPMTHASQHIKQGVPTTHLAIAINVQ